MKMNIVVLAGGISTERDVSLTSGKNIVKALKQAGENAQLLDLFLGFRGSVDELPLQTGQWEIAFQETGVSLTEEALHDWTLAADPRVKYYSGLATYSTSFDEAGSDRSGDAGRGSDRTGDAGRIYLRLDIPSGLAGVRVNGKDCGYAWTEPWTVDITDALVNGQNQLEIDYANTWYNAILGTSEGNAPFDGVWTSGRYWELRPKELIPSGILGVSLVREKP